MAAGDAFGNIEAVQCGFIRRNDGLEPFGPARQRFGHGFPARQQKAAGLADRPRLGKAQPELHPRVLCAFQIFDLLHGLCE